MGEARWSCPPTKTGATTQKLPDKSKGEPAIEISGGQLQMPNA